MADLEAKNLPDIKQEDVKLDTSAVDALKPSELLAVKQKWVCPSRSNEQLVALIEQCPAKIARLEAFKAEPYLIGDKPRDFALIDLKIARLKEQYAVCINEIKGRKAVAIAAIEEPIEEVP